MLAFTLISELTGNMDKREYVMEVSSCYFVKQQDMKLRKYKYIYAKES